MHIVAEATSIVRQSREASLPDRGDCVGAPAGAAGGAVKGEPRFVGSLPAGSPAAATAHTLNAARLDQARSGAPVASHAASRWTWILAWAFAALAAFVFAGFALSRRARPLRARLGSTEATS